MMTDKIVKLTHQAIADLLRSRQSPRGKPGNEEYNGIERRRTPRVSWPFPGTVEIRPLGANDDELCFATCRDVSPTGVGMTCEYAFEMGTPIEIGIHLPEVSIYGKGIVRYCAEIEPDQEAEVQEQFALGIEFDFDD